MAELYSTVWHKSMAANLTSTTKPNQTKFRGFAEQPYCVLAQVHYNRFATLPEADILSLRLSSDE